jgi:hypothetical protein
MSLTTDFLFDENADLGVGADGDLVVGDATDQNKYLLLMAVPGQVRQHPTLGVGITEYVEDSGSTVALEAAIMQTFTADGLTVSSLTIKGDEIKERSEYR